MGFFSAIRKFFEGPESGQLQAGEAGQKEQGEQPVAGSEAVRQARPEPGVITAVDTAEIELPRADVEIWPESEPVAEIAAADDAKDAAEAIEAEQKKVESEQEKNEIEKAAAQAAGPAGSGVDVASGQGGEVAWEAARGEAGDAIATGQALGSGDAGEAAEAAEQGGVPGESGATAEERELILRLRTAEPKLSQWLDIILEGQEEVDERFWRRLKFLLLSLEAPGAEVEAFAADFGRWLERMEYNYIDEFRSELQYRLALALDLEDEEDERNRLLVKLGQGLAATREQFGRRLDSLFARHGKLDDAFWEEMEELFIMSDMGYEPALEIVERLKRRAAKGNVTQPEEARRLLQDELEEIFKAQPRIRAANKPEVILMIGVNGAGKTTTIAKLAHRERMAGKKVLVAAADTFRAAAIEQLQVWAERAGADFYAKPAGSDPASVAWEAMDYALKNDIDIVFIDTAGRLQTRVNLMEELGKIRQVLGKKHPGAPHRSMLVLDATTGQNALSQAKLFKEAAGADEIALTKLDGTAKGGVAIAVTMREGLPITFIGLGEKMEDLRPFNGRDFARAILEEPAGADG